MSDIQIVANVDVLIEMIEATMYQATFSVAKKSDGSPLAGATVTINGLSVTTGADGKATINPLQAGAHDYAVKCEWYLDVTGTLTV